MCHISSTVFTRCGHKGQLRVTEQCDFAKHMVNELGEHIPLLTGCFSNTYSGVLDIEAVCPGCKYRASVGLEGVMITHSISSDEPPQIFSRRSLENKLILLSEEEREMWKHKISEQRLGSRKFSSPWGRVLKEDETKGNLLPLLAWSPPTFAQSSLFSSSSSSLTSGLGTTSGVSRMQENLEVHAEERPVSPTSNTGGFFRSPILFSLPSSSFSSSSPSSETSLKSNPEDHLEQEQQILTVEEQDQVMEGNTAKQDALTPNDTASASQAAWQAWITLTKPRVPPTCSPNSLEHD